MYLKIAITTLIILFNSITFAQQTSNPALSSFRVWKRSGNGSMSGGSATAIDDYLVVTNVHVVGDGTGQSVEIKYPLGNKTYKGTVIAKWADADIALILVTEARLHWSRIGPDPKMGEVLSLFGYGSDSVLKSGSGTVQSGPMIMRGGAVPVITTNHIIETSIQSVSGDSGGGLFNKNGELVAINWGAEQGSRHSVSTPASYIRGLACYWLSNKLSQNRWKEFDFNQYCQPGMPCQPIPWNRPKQPVNPNIPIPMEPISPIQKPDPPVVPPSPDPPVGPNDPPAQIIDYEKISSRVYERIEKEIYQKIEKRYERVYERIEKIEKGKDGKDAVIDYDKLADLIYKKMQEDPDKWKGKDGNDGKDANLDGLSFNVQFQTLDNKGNIVSSGSPIEIPVGGTLYIPPQMLRIRTGDAMFTVGAELGSPIRLQKIPCSKE